MDTNNSILFQVAFKGAVEVFTSGNTETDDVVGEITGLTDVFYEFLSERTGSANPTKAGTRKTSTKKSTASSKKKVSARSGNTEVTIKEPDAPATAPQIKLLKKLLGENDIGFDDDEFDWDDEVVYFDDLTKGSIQEYIEPLKG